MSENRQLIGEHIFVKLDAIIWQFLSNDYLIIYVSVRIVSFVLLKSMCSLLKGQLDEKKFVINFDNFFAP